MTSSQINEIQPPVNNIWKDQTIIEYIKKMDKVILEHRLRIQDNALGEQIMLYLTNE
jgi:hypothetical protein